MVGKSIDFYNKKHSANKSVIQKIDNNLLRFMFFFKS